MAIAEHGLRHLLLGDEGEPSDSTWRGIAEAARFTTVRANLEAVVGSAGWDDVSAALRDSFGKLLDVGVAGIVAGAWAKAEALSRAVEQSRSRPGETVLLALASHEIKSVHRPCIEILIGEAAAWKVEFEVSLALTLEGALLEVRQGVVAAIRPGTCQARARLSFEGQVLLERRTDRVVLPGSIPLVQAEAPAAST